ncbi:hypothetical protein [Alicyclobacillus acidoterrestris]|uniref:Uncharacterized protein n=1 Tax=Alicyclobacillus acidoterrestris (strain ATCC 49025 / DSM 3922 / CIP 106132 / NCIMB 13137 / GD3B) TaxID=1356854 RepID=T0CUN7_ALIAG|nr:hypothetical protein [Alicyclobacillus acidoterrestris]EPZ43072.1 hypothetical protein N007_01645 [Alicyclobacillus acidoterrestris ATCC 49025]UNO49864.1 hypothetical protein K1I37_04970 [Alicyclobacillus acidoterrestris]
MVVIGDIPDPEEFESDGGVVDTPFKTGAFDDRLGVVAAKEVEMPVNNIVIAASVPIIVFSR